MEEAKKNCCTDRESNPGLPRGRREFYHWTISALLKYNADLYILIGTLVHRHCIRSYERGGLWSVCRSKWLVSCWWWLNVVNLPSLMSFQFFEDGREPGSRQADSCWQDSSWNRYSKMVAINPKVMSQIAKAMCLSIMYVKCIQICGSYNVMVVMVSHTTGHMMQINWAARMAPSFVGWLALEVCWNSTTPEKERFWLTR